MKKLSQMFYNLLLMAVIDGLLIYTELGTAHPFQGDTKKILLIAIGDLIWILLVLWGERLSDAWHTCRISTAADGILLILSAPVMIGAVQMITWLSGKRNKSVNYLGSLLKKVTSLSFMNLIGNLIVCYVILGILILLFRKIKTASAVFCWLLILLALINFFVMEFRGEAFFLLDITGIGTAADVAGEYEFKIPLMLGIPLTYSMVFAQFILKFQRLELGKKSRKNLIVRLAFLAVFVVAMAVGFRPLIMKQENVSLWNVNKEYQNKGLVYTFAREFRFVFVEEPEGYSVDAVKKIAEKTEGDPAERQQEPDVIPENIIMIMNESLADFESIGSVRSDVEILPYIHSIDKNVTHGSLHMPTYGGGTARSEYEVLTGNSITFLPSGCVPYELYVRTPEYKLRGFVSDQSVFDKIISLYKEKETNQKLFTFCVTMQNHGGYSQSTLKGYEPDVKLNYETEYPEAQTYLSLARESDKAFQNLVEYFEKVDEPTMIVMFGDHWPKLEEGFLAEVLGKDREKLDLFESQVTYTTPYVIWTNYSSETAEEDISANYLGSYVLFKAGISLPFYNQFLMKLKKQLPVIGVGAVCDQEGNWYASEDLPDNYRQFLSDYNILEYNNQFEKKDVIESLFTLK